MNTHVECYHSVEAFLKCLEAFDVCSNPFESYAFYSVYLRYHHCANFYFFDVYEEAEKIAIIPMACTVDSKLMNTKYFRFIGYRQFNYEQYICRDEYVEKVHNIFMSYLAEQRYHSIVNFYDINNNTALYKLLDGSHLKRKSLKLYLCPCLRFTDSFEEFFKTVYSSSKKRTELKKFQKKLAEIGDFRILNVFDKESHDCNKKYLDQIYRVHSERFAKVYATSLFGSQKMRPYYSDLIESLMRDKKGFISLLLMDEVVIAFIFCLTNGEILIDWIPAFDPAFSKYSLGIVQYKMLFEEMCAPDVLYKTFDYSKGSSVYKRKWAKEETANYQFVVQTSKQNLFSWMLYNLESFKFSFKCYLREKGVLTWIKELLGKLLAFLKGKKNDEKVIQFRYSEGASTAEHLKYSAIVNHPVEVRRELLDCIYQGWRLDGIEENGKELIAYMSKD